MDVEDIPSYTRLCEVHFDESQFEGHRQDGWRKLKLTAVPTIFPNSDSTENMLMTVKIEPPDEDEFIFSNSDSIENKLLTPKIEPPEDDAENNCKIDILSSQIIQEVFSCQETSNQDSLLPLGKISLEILSPQEIYKQNALSPQLESSQEAVLSQLKSSQETLCLQEKSNHEVLSRLGKSSSEMLFLQEKSNQEKSFTLVKSSRETLSPQGMSSPEDFFPLGISNQGALSPEGKSPKRTYARRKSNLDLTPKRKSSRIAQSLTTRKDFSEQKDDNLPEKIERRGRKKMQGKKQKADLQSLSSQAKRIRLMNPAYEKPKVKSKKSFAQELPLKEGYILARTEPLPETSKHSKNVEPWNMFTLELVTPKIEPPDEDSEDTDSVTTSSDDALKSENGNMLSPISLNTDRKALVQELVVLKAQNKSLYQENSRLRKKLKKVEHYSEEVTKENDSLQEEIQEFVKNNRGMSKVILELEKHNNALFKRLTELKNENSVLKPNVTSNKQLDDLQNENSTLTSKVALLEKQNEDLTSKLKLTCSDEQLVRLDKIRELGMIERYSPD